MAPERDVYCVAERAPQREAVVAVMDNEVPPRDTRLHQPNRQRIVRVTNVHQHVRTKFSEKGERGTKSFDWFAAQHREGDDFSDTKDFRHMRNGIGFLGSRPDYSVIGLRLCSN